MFVTISTTPCQDASDQQASFEGQLTQAAVNASDMKAAFDQLGVDKADQTILYAKDRAQAVQVCPHYHSPISPAI